MMAFILTALSLILLVMHFVIRSLVPPSWFSNPLNHLEARNDLAEIVAGLSAMGAGLAMILGLAGFAQRSRGRRFANWALAISSVLLVLHVIEVKILHAMGK